MADKQTKGQKLKSLATNPDVLKAAGSILAIKPKKKKKKGFFGALKNITSKVLPVAASLAPGPIGTAAKVASSVFNDPEWWMNYAGDGVSLTQPLSEFSNERDVDNARRTVHSMRGFWASYSSFRARQTGDSDEITLFPVVNPSVEMISQYLMPAIRKTVNAIALQTPLTYQRSFVCATQLYAMWQCLKKYQYMAEHFLPYLPNSANGQFWALNPENKATLDAYRARVEQMLKSTVRIPHTLCQYLAWRFGRVYKSNDSAKAGLITYDIIPMDGNVEMMTTYIARLISEMTTPSRAQALVDIYNAYEKHDQEVHIKDETQFLFDRKEFVLRTNLDVEKYSVTRGDGEPIFATVNRRSASPDVIIMDSHLDNDTTFTASTTSTISTDPTGSYTCLFPIQGLSIFVAAPSGLPTTVKGGSDATRGLVAVGTGSLFYEYVYDTAGVPLVIDGVSTPVANSVATSTNFTAAKQVLLGATLCKSMDIYNADIYMELKLEGADAYLFDVTAISIDTALVAEVAIANVHKLAFANLTCLKTTYSNALSTKADEAAREIVKDMPMIAEAAAASDPRLSLIHI